MVTIIGVGAWYPISMKTLYLSDNKKVSGVCGGLAEYYNIDANLVRLLALILILFTGVIPGLLVYIVAAIIIPKKPSNL